MRRLLVVEDDPSIRESVADFFRARGFDVTEAETAEAAGTTLTGASFTLVLLDLLLPGRDGLEVLRSLRESGDETPVIVVTARGEEEQRVLGLELGADDYVVKPFSLHELAARIEAVLRRTGARPTAFRLGDVEVDLAGHELRRGERRIKLLQKEAELLAFLLRNPGRTFRREELLREVWGFDRAPTTRTVDTHVFKLRKKIESDAARPRHLETVHGVGYRLVT